MHRQGRTIIAIDHQPALWLDTADEFILLREGGRVAARGLHRGNLPQHRALFAELGLFYPDPPPPYAPKAETGAAILRFEGRQHRAGRREAEAGAFPPRRRARAAFAGPRAGAVPQRGDDRRCWAPAAAA